MSKEKFSAEGGCWIQTWFKSRKYIVQLSRRVFFAQEKIPNRQLAKI